MTRIKRRKKRDTKRCEEMGGGQLRQKKSQEE